VNELPEDLERAFRTLDAQAAMRAERVDPERVAARVLARLRTEEAPAPRVLSLSPGFRLSAFGLRLPAFALAAAAVVLLLAGTTVTGLLRRDVATGSIAVPVVAQGLDSLNQQQLETVLRVAGDVQPLAVQSFGSPAGMWDDLSETQLRAVLQAVQQVQGETL
jgi:hypothetical protein